MIGGRSEGESSISHRRRSRASRLWEPASSRFGSPGRTPGAREIDLGRLARRHGVAPSKYLGQHFLIDTDFARAIAADARVGPGDDVVEIGAGLGSLTRALAEAD